MIAIRIIPRAHSRNLVILENAYVIYSEPLRHLCHRGRLCTEHHVYHRGLGLPRDSALLNPVGANLHRRGVEGEATYDRRLHVGALRLLAHRRRHPEPGPDTGSGFYRDLAAMHLEAQAPSPTVAG